MNRLALFFAIFSVTMTMTVFAQNVSEDLQSLQGRVQQLEETLKQLQLKTEKKEDKNAFSVFWKDGLKFETAEKTFSMHLGGRAYLDFGFVHEDAAITRQLGKMEDYAEIQSARLETDGTLYERFLFKMNFDFVRGSSNGVKFKDVSIGINKLPWDGVLQIGHFKEPFGLEMLTSDRYTSFIYRAPVITTFSPSRNLGIAYFAHDSSKRVTMAMGFFRDTPDDPPVLKTDSGSYAFTTRVTALPYYENEGEYLVHLGLSYSFRSPTADSVRYRAFSEVGAVTESPGNRFVDTGTIARVESIHLVNPELAVVLGPFSLQSEWVSSFQEFEGGATKTTPNNFWGYYVSASYFLTGEHRNYNPKKGVFDKVKIKNHLFGKEDGFGALELAVRYSRLNLNDDDFRGRRLDTMAAGMNWYPIPNLRCMLDYVYSDINNLKGSGRTDAHALMGRFQIYF